MSMTHQSKAALINDLQVPLVVSDVLYGHEALNEVDYALHDLMSDLKPDAALLALAFSVQTIVRPYLQASPILRTTALACRKMIEEHSPLCMDDAQDSLNAAEMLGQVAEDLSYMDELLDLTMEFFAAKDQVAVALCRVLKAQAQAHHLVAETVYHQLSMQQKSVTDIQTIAAKTRQFFGRLVAANEDRAVSLQAV